MKNYFYWTEIENKLLKILRENTDLNNIKTVVSGDFSLMPAPRAQEFYDFFPCILVELKSSNIFYDNKAFDTTSQKYNFNVYYIYPHGGKFSDYDMLSEENTRNITNILMNYRTLGGYEMDKSSTESGFKVIDSNILNISFDNEIRQIFLDMDIPLSVSIIEYSVDVKTLRRIENENLF